jgi:hypothetical protein
MATLIVEFLAGVFLVMFTGYLMGSFLEKLTHKRHTELRQD